MRLMLVDNRGAFDQATGLFVFKGVRSGLLSFGFVLDGWNEVAFLLIQVEDGKNVVQGEA